MSSDDTSENALSLIEREFSKRVRYIWHDGRWFFSVIDVVAVLTDSAQPRVYWAKMKARVRDEGFHELLTRCQQLKLRSSDGKYYTTDAADTETLLRLIQSIPSPKAEPFKQWLARVGSERIQEEAQPALAVERLRKLYQRKGYSDEWIAQRLESIGIRTIATSEWNERGAKEGKQFAILTDTLSTGTFNISTSAHKAIKGLTPRQNLQDSMTVMELALNSLAEATAVTLHRARDSQGFGALHEDCAEAGEVGGAARRGSPHW